MACPCRACVLLACLSLVASGWGCGQRGAPTYPVSGTVTFDGQPVVDGDILFVPADKSLGPNAGKITAGRYAFRSTAGKQQVQIRAARLIPGAPPGPMNIPATESYIPPQYNEQTTLTIEVVADADNVFPFELDKGD